MMNAPVLIVAPHALDEVLGCGGTMAAHSVAGDTVHVLVLCGDGTGHDGKRREAGAAAAEILGVESYRYCGIVENRSDALPIGSVVGMIESAVQELQPQTIYVSHGGNLNIDHQSAFRATATALRPVPGNPVKRFFGYEVASSTDWAPPGFGQPFHPTHFVDISQTLDKKLLALEAYGVDMRPEPHARSIPAIDRLARVRGASVGLAAAEAFVVYRSLIQLA